MKNPPSISSSQHLFRLRPTLTGLIVSLLLITVGAIGSLVYMRTSASIGELIEQQFEAHVDATSSAVDAMLAPAAHGLFELQSLAQREVLPVDEPDTLSVFLLERLRANTDLAWVGWADTDDHYVAANRRPGNRLITFFASPQVNDSLPALYQVAEDGGRSPIFPAGEINVAYRPSERPWYQPALAAQGLLWHKPYSFGLGTYGITASIPTFSADKPAQPSGVFTIDFFLEDIVAFLKQVELGDTGRVILLTPDGTQIGGSAQNSTLHELVAHAAHAWLQDRTLPALNHHSLTYQDIQYRVALEPLQQAHNPPWLIVIAVPETELTGVLFDNAVLTLLAALTALGIALLLASLLSRRIAEPIRQMSDDLGAVGRFELSETPAPDSYIREVAILGDSIDRMKRGLRSFGRYIPGDVVKRLLAQGKEAQLGGEMRQLTIHFSDIAGFTSVAEHLTPLQTVDELADYFELMTETISNRDGTVDKFMGDGILAFFNAPHSVPEHPAQACHAALEAQQRLTDLRRLHKTEGRPELSARIGLAMGEVLVGNIGTHERFAYTVVGDTVNLAARLESLNKYYGTSILATDKLRHATGDLFAWRHLDRARVVGRIGVTDIYELVAKSHTLSEQQFKAQQHYETAIQQYIAGDFKCALTGFKLSLAICPNDLAARQLLSRCSELLQKPPSKWTGVYEHQHK